MHLLLEPFLSRDFDRLIGWIDSEAALVRFAGPLFTFPLDHRQLEAYLADPDRYAFRVRLQDTEEVIGHAEVYLPQGETCRLCRILIGPQAWRSRGLGSELIRLLLEYCWQQFGQDTVVLHVFEWNKAAIRCYEKNGFRIVPGVVREIHIANECWRALRMEHRGPNPAAAPPLPRH